MSKCSIVRKIAVICSVAALTSVLAAVPSNGVEQLQDQDVYAEISDTEIVLGNSFIERRWRPDRLQTTRFYDKRTEVVLAEPTADFALQLDGVEITSNLMAIEDAEAQIIERGGIGIVFTLIFPGVRVTRRVEAYPGIAGFRSLTALEPTATLVLSGYDLERVAVGNSAAPTTHSFRAGADWRFDDGWNPVGVGDPRKGDWRLTKRLAPGTPVGETGQWISMGLPSGRSAFMVIERRDYASSILKYDGEVASAGVDFSRDIVYFGPFEENVHADNPTTAPTRHRTILPLQRLDLESVFLGFGTGPDDEPWQHFRYLPEHRLAPYKKAVTFNTNNIDSNRISTGAKDDVDFTTFKEQLLPAARDIGVETFILDDGWQARSGDWCPDSPACPEPRWDGSADSKFKPRFPDSTFSAVGEQLRGDPSTTDDDISLGLWWTPMEFHPSSDAFRRSPGWACHPVGDGTAAINLAQPNSSSNEAGIGVWNPLALGTHPDTGSLTRLTDYIQQRIERAIDIYGARYFKFDFLVWIDCLGIDQADMYQYHDAFVAMVDRLQALHPEVTFQIDETNDYRMFPFESVARGPSWFQNGSPPASQLLHNLWVLNPYIPGFSIGQHTLGNAIERASLGIDYLMAVGLGSHVTFWSDISKLSAVERAQVRRWTDFYKANRDLIATFTYPLLDDPLAGGWTALQPWNPDRGDGFLLAYRQGAANETHVIPLRAIAGGAYELTEIDPATGTSISVGTFDADSLRSGVSTTILMPYGFKIIRIARV